MSKLRLIPPATFHGARCQLTAAEARILHGSDVVAHRQLFHLNDSPRPLELRVGSEQATVLMEPCGDVTHATLVASDGASLELDLRVEGASDAVIEVWGVAAGRSARASITDSLGAELCITIGLTEESEMQTAQPIRLAPGRFVLCAEIGAGILMLRLQERS